MELNKLNLSELTVREKVEFARHLAISIASQPRELPAPPHSQIKVETAMRSLEVAYDTARLARMVSLKRDQELNEIEAALDLLLQQQIEYVESVSHNDGALLRNVGLPRKSA